MERREVGDAPRDPVARPESEIAIVLHHVGIAQELLQHDILLPLVVDIRAVDDGQHVRERGHRLLHPEDVDLLHVRVVELGLGEKVRDAGDLDAAFHQHVGETLHELAIMRLGLDENLDLARAAARRVLDLVMEEPQQLAGDSGVLHPRRRRDPDFREIARRSYRKPRVAEILAHAPLEEAGTELEIPVARRTVDVVHQVPPVPFPAPGGGRAATLSQSPGPFGLESRAVPLPIISPRSHEARRIRRL